MSNERAEVKTSEYLYGASALEWFYLSYPAALRKKIELANALIDELQKVHWKERDFQRVADIVNAIKFNEMLLKE